MKVDLHDLLLFAAPVLFLCGLFWLHIAAGVSGLGVVAFVAAMAVVRIRRRRRGP